MTARREGALRTVRLLDVPAATFIRLQLHIDDLLRELEIIDVGHDSEAVLVPTELGKVTRDLLEAYSSTRADAWQQAEAAERAGRDTLDIEVSLPTEAAEAAEELACLFDRADELARDGVLLTLPTPAPLMALRTWMREELLRQLRDGAEPTPYAE